MHPLSDNIIFLDTEFSSLDPYKGEILSIGMVKLSGEELYFELEFEGELSDWSREHILPMLTGSKVNREKAQKRIREFVGQGKPYMVTFVTQYDAIYLYKLFATDNPKEERFPFHMWPIDFAAILFGAGINPEHYLSDANGVLTKMGIDVSKYKEHHALDDARLLRETWMKFFGK